jgi:DNA-binding SARP family transcriptional activator
VVAQSNTKRLGLAWTTRRRSQLRLLSSFELRRAGAPVSLPQSAERLLAFLAVHDRALERSFVAGSLWLDATDARALGSLRSALWRVHTVYDGVIDVAGTRLCLAPEVEVDLRVGHSIARQLLDHGRFQADVGSTDALTTLEADLLPDWYVEDWLALPREQWRQLRLHALEALAVRLAQRGDFAAAVAAALASIRGDPLRESAHRSLVRVHLAEGNICEAISTYRRFRTLLLRELGVEPSSVFGQLLDGVMPR